jgi:hypothetical protein
MSAVSEAAFSLSICLLGRFGSTFRRRGLTAGGGAVRSRLEASGGRAGAGRSPLWRAGGGMGTNLPVLVGLCVAEW